MMRLKDVPTTWSAKELVFKFTFVVLCLFVVWAQCVKLFPNGIFDVSGNLIYFGRVVFHDSNVHLSLGTEMLYRFPPTNMGFQGIPLKNYHYLYDIFLALGNRLTGISLFDLYFRIYPILISLFLCVTIYLTIYKLTKNRWISLFGIYITIFSTSLGWLLPFIKQVIGGRPVTGGSNIFMTDQIIDMMVNPHGGLSLVFFLVLFLMLEKLNEKQKISELIIFSLVLGLSFGLKAYGGIISALASVLVAVRSLVQRKWDIVFACTLGLSVMALWIWQTIDGSVAGTQIAPLWIIEKMMIELDRINEPRFILLLQHFEANGNYLKYYFLQLLGVIVYVVGSLGLRIFGLAVVFNYLKSWKRLTPGIVFLLTGAFLSLMIPLLTNQTKKAYDIVQFTPYFTLTMGIMFSVFLFKVSKILKRKVFILIFILVCGLTLISNHNEIRSRILEPARESEKIVIDNSIVQAAGYVKKNTPPKSIFLIAPSESNLSFLWFVPLFERRTVYSGRGFEFQVGLDTDKEEKRLADVFSGKVNDELFDYVFLTRGEMSQFAKITETYTLKVVYENSGSVVLQRI